MVGFLLALVGCVPAEAPAPESLRTASYKGWHEALFLEASEGRVSLISIPAVAGRIIHYGRQRENILFENPDYLGKTMANTNPDSLAQGYIGYNIDLGPELRGIPPHLSLWMGPYAWSGNGERILMTSQPDLSVGIRIEKEIRLHPKTGDLSLVQTMTNISEGELAYCLWDRTLCKGGGFALVPLRRKSRYKAGWSLLKDGAYHGDDPSHPNVKILDGVLVVEARGPGAKLGVDSESGWVAYVRGKCLFVKYFPHFSQGAYTDGGNSVEIYFDPKVCELEPLSPEVTLKPGEEYSFPEKWVLVELDHEVIRADQARALVDRITESPFCH
jgi:hypothetical protein